jgi:hypothetical protein
MRMPKQDGVRSGDILAVSHLSSHGVAESDLFLPARVRGIALRRATDLQAMLDSQRRTWAKRSWQGKLTEYYVRSDR